MSIGVSFPDGATDVIIRGQRIAATHEMTLECWNTGTGAYQVSTAKLGSDCWGNKPLEIGNQPFLIGSVWAPFNGTIDYGRFSSKPAPTGSLPSPSPSGDLGDWELDGNGHDVSSHHSNLVFNKSPVYVTTPEYPPAVAFLPGKNCFSSTRSSPNFCISIADRPTPLVANIYSSTLNDALTYSWGKVDGPTEAKISNSSSEKASATGLTKFGQYDFRLNVTDGAGHHASATLMEEW